MVYNAMAIRQQYDGNTAAIYIAIHQEERLQPESEGRVKGDRAKRRAHGPSTRRG
jgi:hypothetical protein